jgi:hypothetical protein
LTAAAARRTGSAGAPALALARSRRRRAVTNGPSCLVTIASASLSPRRAKER